MNRRKRRILKGEVLALIVSAGLVQAEGDPEGRRNLALEARLPQGEGLAAKFSGDRDVRGHASVIFADNFESGDLESTWDEVRNRDNRVLKLVDASSGDSRLGKRSLQSTATLGENTGGGVTKWFQSAPSVHVRFYVKFAPDCDYVHHFATLRANRSLRGRDKWSGFGGAGNKPAGDDRFSTALEPWGNWGKSPPPGRWNFYSYWHSMKRGGDGKYWGNAFRPAEQEDIVRDRWICCEFMLKHNTPGKDDGEQAYWIDGKLTGHWKGISWRTSPTLFANALTVESYVTDRWTKQKTNTVFFDNVVIAKEYIGPSGK